MKKILFSILFLLSATANAAIEKDKVLHFGVSYSISYASSYFIDNPIYSFALCGGIGLTKEIYDEVDYGGFSEKDMLANVAGCASGLITKKLLGHTIRLFPSDRNDININYQIKF